MAAISRRLMGRRCFTVRVSPTQRERAQTNHEVYITLKPTRRNKELASC